MLLASHKPQVKGVIAFSPMDYARWVKTRQAWKAAAKQGEWDKLWAYADAGTLDLNKHLLRRTPLMFAARQGAVEAIATLREKYHVDPNKVVEPHRYCEQKFTVLGYAVQTNRVDVVRAVLQFPDVDPTLGDQSAVSLCMQAKISDEVARVVVDAVKDTTPKRKLGFYHALNSNMSHRLQWLVDKFGVAVFPLRVSLMYLMDQFCGFEMQPASVQWYIRHVQRLVEGAEDAKELARLRNVQQSILEHGCRRLNVHVVQCSLDCGAKADAAALMYVVKAVQRDRENHHPRYSASPYGGAVTMLRRLLAQGADPCKKVDTYGMSALYFACMYGEDAAVRVFLKESLVPVDVTIPVYAGRTPLQAAAVDLGWRPPGTCKAMEAMLRAHAAKMERWSALRAVWVGAVVSERVSHFNLCASQMCPTWKQFNLDHVGKVDVVDGREWSPISKTLEMHCKMGMGCLVMLHTVPGTLTPDVIFVPDSVTGAVRIIYVAVADPAEVAALSAADAALVAEFIGEKPVRKVDEDWAKYHEWYERCKVATTRFAQAVFLKTEQHKQLTAALRGETTEQAAEETTGAGGGAGGGAGAGAAGL